MPVVTQTAERCGDRPVANALGNVVSAIATTGLGMSASAHSRSIMPWSSGACSGVTTRARIARSAALSELYHWYQAIPSPIRAITGTSPPKPAWIAIHMSTTMNATNSAPSRNITVVIRRVSPRSGAKRVRVLAMIVCSFSVSAVSRPVWSAARVPAARRAGCTRGGLVDRLGVEDLVAGAGGQALRGRCRP